MALLSSGSYVFEIAHPSYVFESVRIDITSKGKIRARRVNNIQPSSVQTVTYPLRFKPRGMATYFHTREQWRITDFLFSPMVNSKLNTLLISPVQCTAVCPLNAVCCNYQRTVLDVSIIMKGTRFFKYLQVVTKYASATLNFHFPACHPQ